MGQVRRATPSDVGEIVHFIKEYHSTDSNLKDIPFIHKDMFHTINYFLNAPRHVVYVYDDGGVKGLLMGSLEHYPHNRKQVWAGDTMFIASAGGAYLLRKFMSWAKANKATRVYMAVSTGDAKADALYQACGMERIGGMYRVVYS